MEENKSNNEIIQAINEVIKQSIIHGGDWGGPYFCYPKEQQEAVEKLARMLFVGVTFHKDSDYGDNNWYELADEVCTW